MFCLLNCVSALMIDGVCWPCVLPPSLSLLSSPLLSPSLAVILLHSSLRQRSLKSKVNVGLINMLGGGGSGKHEDGADDSLPFESDPENPSGSSSGRGGVSDADLAKLGGAGNDALLAEQQKFRSAFRASMRNKYLKKG